MTKVREDLSKIISELNLSKEELIEFVKIYIKLEEIKEVVDFDPIAFRSMLLLDLFSRLGVFISLSDMCKLASIPDTKQRTLRRILKKFYDVGILRIKEHKKLKRLGRPKKEELKYLSEVGRPPIRYIIDFHKLTKPKEKIKKFEEFLIKFGLPIKLNAIKKFYIKFRDDVLVPLTKSIQSSDHQLKENAILILNKMIAEVNKGIESLPNNEI